MSANPETRLPVRIEGFLAFQHRLLTFPRAVQTNIIDAYSVAQEAHQGQMRISKEAYFEHLRSVALILLDECGITDPAIIKAALLHDTMEDTTIFGDPATMDQATWTEHARQIIAASFGEETAGIVVSLTKPPFVDPSIPHEERHSAYYNQLAEASPKALLVKMADRLHNLRTQYSTPVEQQLKKIQETQRVYLPLFRKVLDDYPIEGEYLLMQIEEELELLQAHVFNTTKE